MQVIRNKFLRTKFICIIWTVDKDLRPAYSSWGLSLFVLFELAIASGRAYVRSWGLSLFVLFEQKDIIRTYLNVLED